MSPKHTRKRRWRAARFYGAALFVLLWSLVFPLYRWWHILLCAFLTFLLFFAYKPTQEAEEEPEVPPDDSKLDQEAREFIRRLEEDDWAIADEAVSARIRQLVLRTRQIYTRVSEHPEKRPQIRRFSHQYLPMTLKLLDHYAELEATGLSSENIIHSREEIGRVLEIVETAFEKQLDALYQADALDISTDITVLKSILQQNNLTDSTDFDSESPSK